MSTVSPFSKFTRPKLPSETSVSPESNTPLPLRSEYNATHIAPVSSGVGVASSKKEAEQIASKEALKQYGELGEDEY